MNVNSQMTGALLSCTLGLRTLCATLPATLVCNTCFSRIPEKPYGYVEMLKEPWNHVAAQEDYIEVQEHAGLRVFQDYLLLVIGERVR